MKIFTKYASSIRRFSTDRNLEYIKKLISKEHPVILDLSRNDKIAFLALNYKEKRNALSKNFVKEIYSALNQLHSDNDVRGLVLMSAVPGVFCAGADLKERALVDDKDVPALVKGLRKLFQNIYELKFPTIAAIDGAALGGGLEMALSCDLRYTSTNAKVKIGLVETGWALLPGAGGTQRLPRLIGESKAKELIFTSSVLSGKEAYNYGITNGINDSQEDFAAALLAMETAIKISEKGPIAVKQAKRAIEQGLRKPLEDGLNFEGDCYEVIVPTKDRKEGMKAFAEKRKPLFKGE